MSDIERVDAVVIGAGVVGLAIARELARAGREVIILEAANAFGTGTSSRNSEVLHAGLYYPADWLKTQLCLEGRPLVEAFCEAHGVAWQRIGKLVVASDESERAALHALLAGATRNGVRDLRLIDGGQARAMEPALSPSTVAAIVSPNTGIVDSHGLMSALLGDAEQHGAVLALASPASSIWRGGGRLIVDVASEPPMSLAANLVVNAAGLGATALAKRTDMGAAAQAATPNLNLSKGNYFTLSARAPFSRLIYPVAKHATLGVHLTLDLGGQARFGPDIEWLDPAVQDPLQVDMRVDPTRAAAFEQSVRRFWPELPADALMPGFCGLRPKIHGPGEPLRDFVVQGVADHGVPGLVQLFGIESPGLTSCIALARHTLKLLALEPAPA